MCWNYVIFSINYKKKSSYLLSVKQLKYLQTYRTFRVLSNDACICNSSRSVGKKKTTHRTVCRDIWQSNHDIHIIWKLVSQLVSYHQVAHLLFFPFICLTLFRHFWNRTTQPKTSLEKISPKENDYCSLLCIRFHNKSLFRVEVLCRCTIKFVLNFRVIRTSKVNYTYNMIEYKVKSSDKLCAVL